MEMRIDERRGYEPVGCIDFLGCLMFASGGYNIGDLAVLDQNVLLFTSVGKIGVSYNQIEHRRTFHIIGRGERQAGSAAHFSMPYTLVCMCAMLTQA
ncbi:hypothetical protein D3C79_942730 [compost metagenome]